MKLLFCRAVVLFFSQPLLVFCVFFAAVESSSAVALFVEAIELWSKNLMLNFFTSSLARSVRSHVYFNRVTLLLHHIMLLLIHELFFFFMHWHVFNTTHTAIPPKRTVIYLLPVRIIVFRVSGPDCYLPCAFKLTLFLKKLFWTTFLYEVSYFIPTGIFYREVFLEYFFFPFCFHVGISVLHFKARIDTFFLSFSSEAHFISKLFLSFRTWASLFWKKKKNFIIFRARDW